MNIKKTNLTYLALILVVMLFSFTGCVKVPLQVSETAANNSHLEVHYIDVGQGDSIFISIPNGETMLIDAGNPDDGKIVVDYINDLGEDKIDYLVGTHPHADHIGGLSDVVNAFDIGQVFMPEISHNTKAYDNLIDAIKSKGLEVSKALGGKEILNDNEIKIEMIAPNDDKYDDLNDYSAVIKIPYNKNSFLFTGDIEEYAENELLERGFNIDSDVLKVAHHGSSSSSSESFINAVSPEYAVICCGEGNAYGHPTARTLKTLQKYNIEIYRTDIDGTIIITSDGQNIKCKRTVLISQDVFDILENIRNDITMGVFKYAGKYEMAASGRHMPVAYF